MTAWIKYTAEGCVSGDDATRLATVTDETAVAVRPYTAEENATADAAAAESKQQATRADLAKADKLDARLKRLAAYKTDAEIAAALARTNTTVPTTQELNRLLKVMLRREERLSAAVALLVRLIAPALLADAADTTDA